MTATVHTAYFPYTRAFLGWVRDAVCQVATLVGEISLMAMQTVRFVAARRVSKAQLIEQCQFIGVDALGIAMILTLFSGMVIALQVAQELSKQGAGELVGALVSLSILRELAPIMTGFAVIAMVGSAFAAELATMKIQQQVDALKVLHVDPVRYLVVPRILAGVMMMPLMTVITGMAGIVGGMVVSSLLADLNYNRFMESVWSQTEAIDLIGLMIKAGVFGFLIVLISTTIGLRAKGGAKEVGLATTQAVVWSFVAMAIADYVLSYVLFGGTS